jgi:serine phosphatase RsbU (regulator of sigma subunit)
MLAVFTAGLLLLSLFNWLAIRQVIKGGEDWSQSFAEGALQGQIELAVRNLALEVAMPWDGGDTTAVRRLLDAAVERSPHFEWAALTVGSTEVWSAAAPQEEVRAALGGGGAAGGEVVRQSLPGPGNRAVYSTAVYTSGPVGRLSVGYHPAELTRQLAQRRQIGEIVLRRAAWQGIAAGVIVLVLAALCGLRLRGQLARRLALLNAQARAVAEGDFRRHIEVDAADELGELADNFNAMTRSLQTTVAQLTQVSSLEKELAVATSVQALMSPPPTLVDAGAFSVAGYCQLAAGCGGDWWTYRPLDHDRLLLVVGDVTGHGLPAAMIAATARGAVEAMCRMDDVLITPEGVLRAIDGAIRDLGGRELQMTCFAMILNPRNEQVRYANASHCFPVMVTPGSDGRLSEPESLISPGNPLGSAETRIAAGERNMAPGQLFVLMSDGLVDSQSASGHRFGERRLRQLLKEHRWQDSREGVAVLRDEIVATMQRHAGPVAPVDDVTLVVCQFRGLARERRRPMRGRIVAGSEGVYAVQEEVSTTEALAVKKNLGQPADG